MSEMIRINYYLLTFCTLPSNTIYKITFSNMKLYPFIKISRLNSSRSQILSIHLRESEINYVINERLYWFYKRNVSLAAVRAAVIVL